jgi:membrane associated rhomboid family serine protease
LQPKQSGEREPVFNAPTAVIVLIAALIVAHAIRDWLPYQDNALMIALLAFIPARLTEMGATMPGGITAGYTSMLTHAFLHADWLHLTLNSVWLLVFGTLMARRCGALGFLALFAASSIAGAFGFFLVNSDQTIPMIGASGGVSGLMGGAFRVIFSAMNAGAMQVLREHPTAVPRMPLQVALFDRRTLLGVGIWLAVNFIFGLGLGDFLQSGEVAWEAHVGGFLFGFLFFRWFDRGMSYKDIRPYDPSGRAQ